MAMIILGSLQKIKHPKKGRSAIRTNLKVPRITKWPPCVVLEKVLSSFSKIYSENSDVGD